MKILVTGATGSLGSLLCPKIKNLGHELVILSRNSESAKSLLNVQAQYFDWQPEASVPPPASLEGVDAIVHLAGESIVNKRWTADQKNRIFNSRIFSTRNLVTGLLARRDARPLVLISASAVGFYGDTKDSKAIESSPSGEGFLASVCRSWEEEALRLEKSRPNSRVILLRTGLILSDAGGALEKIAKIFSTGLGGILGSGEQWMSWIHERDAVSIILFLMDDQTVSGPVNVVAPEQVTNRQFTAVLAKALNRPSFFRVPAFMLRSLFGEMGDELFLSSAKVYPQKLVDEGYQFKFDNLRSAIDALVN